MNDFSTTIYISSSYTATKPHLLSIEPWGETYWLFPRDGFLITAIGSEASPHFSVSVGDDDEVTWVGIEGDCQDFTVQHNGKYINSGYQSPVFVGQIEHAFLIAERGMVITSGNQWSTEIKVKDELRIIIPNIKTVTASVLGFEHINTGDTQESKNSFGIFLGDVELDKSEIMSTSSVYKVLNS